MSEIKPIYFDNASATKPFPAVIETMNFVLQEIYGNASSQHFYGRKAKTMLEESREIIASIINAKPSEIFFTSGGTESVNFCVRGIANALYKEFSCLNILTSKVEHSASNESFELLKNDCKFTYFPTTQFAKIYMPESFALNEKIIFASLIHTNNETGATLDDEIVRKLKQNGAIIHLDAVQSFCKFNLDVSKLPVDALSFSSHKIHGPKGVGAIYLRSGTPIEKIIVGGPQERNKRGGTENLAGIIGFAKAAKLFHENSKNYYDYVSLLKNKFIDLLREIDSKGIRINSDHSFSPYILNVTFMPEYYKLDVETALIFLDLNGLCASAGSACTSGIFKYSKTLAQAGMSEEEAKRSIRFSFSIFNDEKEIDRAADIIFKLTRKFKIN